MGKEMSLTNRPTRLALLILSLAGWIAAFSVTFTPPVFAWGGSTSATSAHTDEEIIAWVEWATSAHPDFLDKLKSGYPFALLQTTSNPGNPCIELWVSKDPTKPDPNVVLNTATPPTKTLRFQWTGGRVDKLNPTSESNCRSLIATFPQPTLQHTNMAGNSIVQNSFGTSALSGAHTYIIRSNVPIDIQSDLASPMYTTGFTPGVYPDLYVDLCPNIAGNQETIPTGMELDENGDCIVPPGAGGGDAGVAMRHIQIISVGVTGVIVLLILRQFRWRGTA